MQLASANYERQASIDFTLAHSQFGEYIFMIFLSVCG